MMMYEAGSFFHHSRGVGRPQIVLVGNGLEYKSGQFSWDKLLDELTVNNCHIAKEDREKIPFPLLYELLSSTCPATPQLSRTAVNEEERRLAKAMRVLTHASNSELDILPTLGADHIFTTNYSYCIEKAFDPRKNFLSSTVRSKARFNLASHINEGKGVREINYRIHTGYLVNNTDGSPLGIWHIHGECTVPLGIVIGHDRYGRLLSRIEKICGSQIYTNKSAETVYRKFVSWPELFLYGDIYIVGFGFNLCEFDLWWLLRRKQREFNADGRVYFYDNSRLKGDPTRDMLLKAHGVLINPDIAKEDAYDVFYQNALAQIAERIKLNKFIVS